MDKINTTRLPLKIGTSYALRDFIKYVKKIESLTSIHVITFIEIRFVYVNNNLLYIMLSNYTVHTWLHRSIASISWTRVSRVYTRVYTHMHEYTAVLVVRGFMRTYDSTCLACALHPLSRDKNTAGTF
jgi:hypothetical protein